MMESFEKWTPFVYMNDYRKYKLSIQISILDFVGHDIQLEAIKTIKSQKLIETNTIRWGKVTKKHTLVKHVQNYCKILN